MKKRKMRLVLSLFLAIVMTFGYIPGIGFAGITVNAYSGSGDGLSEASAYEIANVGDLQALADTVNGSESYENRYFKLMGNIDLSGISS